MRKTYLIYIICSFLVLCCKWCKDTDAIMVNDAEGKEVSIPADSLIQEAIKITGEKEPLFDLNEVHDTVFINLRDYSSEFRYDLRYATKSNFLKAKVYDCAECYTRAVTAKALMKANKDFLEKGYRIKFFDCYRPNSVQWKMWKLVPNPQYVANPAKGSIHNKGGAVDITLVDLKGKELDMGTGFDFFGKEAHHDFVNLPEEVLTNRKLLKSVMEKYGFWSIRTEWWHYNLNAASNYPVADFKWKCN